MDDWQKAGKIAAECLEFARKIARPGIKLLDLAEQVEAKIFALGARPAFPVNLSINNIAAHYAPLMDDRLILKDDDLLKIDVGVHVNGCIGDTAITVGSKTDLIMASEKALENAIRICKPGIKLNEIGKEIESTINSFGFQPVRNLSGHVILPYNLHSGLSIPNFECNDKRELKEGQYVAIEPFASTGVGMISEGVPSNIYLLANPRPVRDLEARKLLAYIKQEYSTLPFAARWLEKKFGKLGFGFRTLVKDGVIKSYPQLLEKEGVLISQAEHTILIKDKPEVLTRI